MTSATNVTSLLRDWRTTGDDDALRALTPLVYDELHRIAERYMHSERSGHTLQATALVNEAFVRMADSDVPWVDRAHFFALAARTMRRILTDYARARLSAKRGAGAAAITLHEGLVPGDDTGRLLDIDEALDKLGEIDARKSDILVLHYFGGLTYEETAEALGVSPATVDRDLRLAKAWLASELGDD